MLYVFHVDIGMMLTFDMSVAMQSVVQLQDAIMKQCNIPHDKQVLLISGGDNLDPSARVCSYSSGTDSNPIFLFSKVSIESATPPTMTGDYIQDAGLLSQIETSLHLPPTYETIACRAQLALHLSDVAREMYISCQRLVLDQHLQHQGWAAVTANLDDITSAFRSRSEVFLKSFDEYLSTRQSSLEVLSGFEVVTQLLNTIPLLSCLSTLSVNEAKTLLDWINAQDKRNTLEQMVQQCQAGFDQFDMKLRESLTSEISAMLSTLDNANMIEVKGVEERLSRLEHMMIKAKDSFDDIVNSAQGLVQNQTRARSLQDTTVIPDLCMKHRELLTNMCTKFQILQDLHRRINAAKDELSANLHTRLRWVMLVEKSICDIDSRLIIRHETLKKIKHRIDILCQIHAAPTVYCRALVEVVRRKQFSSQFVQWSDTVYEKYHLLQQREKDMRDQFETCIGKHFLKALFPGFDELPSSLISKLNPDFDKRLPEITRADIEFVQRSVPQLANELRFSSEDFTVVSVDDDSVPIACDVSSQSVEIISHEESQLLKLAVLEGQCSDDLSIQSNQLNGSEDNGRCLSEAFMTADFYIDESLPSSPATDCATRRGLADVNATLHDKIVQVELMSKQLSDLQTVNSKLEKDLSDSNLLNDRMRRCFNDLQRAITPGTDGVTPGADGVTPGTDGVTPGADCFKPVAEQSLFTENDSNVVDNEFDEFVVRIKCCVSRQEELEAELEQQRTHLSSVETELQQYKLATDLNLQQLESDRNDQCSRIEDLQNDKKLLEDSVSELRESLLQAQDRISNFQNEKEMALVMHEENTKIQQKESEKLLMQIEELKHNTDILQEKYNEKVTELKLSHELSLEEAKTCQSLVEQDKQRLEAEMKDLQDKAKTMEAELSSVSNSYQQVSDKINQLILKYTPESVEDKFNTDDISSTLTDFLENLLKIKNEQHEDNINSLIEQNRSKLDEIQGEVDQLRITHQQNVDCLVERHSSDIEQLQKNSNEMKENYEQEKRLHYKTLEDLTSCHEGQIKELRDKLAAQKGENDDDRQLVVEDYLPLQRHEEIVNNLTLELKSADEQKTAELKLLEIQHDQMMHDLKTKLINKHEFELQELKNQHEQEIFTLKCESMKHDVVRSHMTESVMPVSVTQSMHGNLQYKDSKPNEVIEEEIHKLEEKLAELSLSPQDYEQIRQRINIGSCKEGDIGLFTWDEAHRHYLALLPDDCPKHFLHSECLESLGLSPDGYALSENAGGSELTRKSILLQITNREYCLAKKANNRFRVPVNTKFFRVKAQLYKLVVDH